MSGFVAIVPARLASTRLPRKPLADLAGVPMVIRVAAQAKAAGARRVVVATDTAEIVDLCAQHGVEALLTSAEHSTGTDRLSQASALLALDDDEIVVNVQGDEPLVPPALVRACADTLLSHPDCAVATVAHAIDTQAEFANPNVVKVVIDSNDHALYFSRASIPFPRDFSMAPGGSLPPGIPVLRHVGLYAYRASFLRAFPNLNSPEIERFECLEQLRVLYHGYAIAVYVTSERPPAGVDTPDDLARVRAELEARSKTL